MTDIPDPPPEQTQAEADHIEHMKDHTESRILHEDQLAANTAARLLNANSYRTGVQKARAHWKTVIGLAVVAGLAFGAGFAISVNHASGLTAPPPHVMVVMLENKGYAATLGTCSSDPYYCSLAKQYTSVVGWEGVRHPSLPNYLAITTGSTQGCTADTCTGNYIPSLGGQLVKANIPWVGWMESMPSACYAHDALPYVRHHNPFTYENDTQCSTHDIKYPGASGAVAALTANNAPDFVWITPNDTDNMHTGTVQQGDTWLKANIAPILASSWFTNGNATVIITMDEGDPGTTNSIPNVVISSKAKGQGNVAISGNLYGTLRSIEEAYNLPLLGAAASIANGDIFGLFGSGSVTPTPTPSPTASPTASPSGTPGPTPTIAPTPTGTPGPATVACVGDITTKLQSAVNKGGTVTISSGTCALSNHITVTKAVIIEGAGQTETFLVQHAAFNIFQITAQHVTVEDINLDTRTYNPGVPPIPKSPVPGVLFSNASYTSVINMTGEAGTGFGMRVTGPNPCYTFQTKSTVVEGVDMTSGGTGGFASIDIDCTNGATLSDNVASGGIVALFNDENVTLTGLLFTRGEANSVCEPAVFVTGPANHITASQIITNSAIDRISPPTSAISISGMTLPGDSC